MKKILISAFILPLLFTGCVSNGVSDKGKRAWESAIKSKSKNSEGQERFTPLPNPVLDNEAGQFYIPISSNDGLVSKQPVENCKDAYAEYRIDTVSEVWGRIVESRAYDAGIFIGREDGIASPDITGAVKAGTSTVKTFTVDFGTVEVKKIPGDPVELKANLSETCRKHLIKLDKEGYLDETYVVLTTVRVPSLDYTFKLNPNVDIESGIDDSAVPEPGTEAVRAYETACGAYVKGDWKLLKFLNLAFDGKYCVSGETSIKTSQPAYIAEFKWEAKKLKPSDESSGGYILTGEPATELKTVDAAELPKLLEILGE